MATRQLATYDFLVTPIVRARGNLAEYVVTSLRRAILTLELEPGTPIDRQEVCARLGVSRWPVSEALALLQHEGLVEVLPQRGSLVSRIRLAEIVDYLLIRRALESEAVSLCAAMGDAGLIASLTADLRRMRRAVRDKDVAEVEAADLLFHQHIAESLGLPRFGGAIENARGNLDRARRLIKRRAPGAQVTRRHTVILDAIAAGDVTSAAAAMRTHLDGIIVEIVDFALANAAQFSDSVEATAARLHLLFPAHPSFVAPPALEPA